jgi:hypothetical protein
MHRDIDIRNHEHKQQKDINQVTRQRNGHEIKLYKVSVTLPHELTYNQTYTPLASSSSSAIMTKSGNSVSGHLNLIAGLSGGDGGVTTLGLRVSNCVLISFVSCVINL